MSKKDYRVRSGRPKKYSDIAIITVLTLKQVYHLPLRASQGFTESLFNLMGINIEVPCYTRVCRRQAAVTLPKLPTLCN